jgi:threonyl-tRNA synthetase
MSEEDLYPLRLTSAALLGYLIHELFPEAQALSTGVSEIGFWRDFVLPQPLDETLIPQIEEEWRGLLKRDLPILLREMMRENAAERFRHHQFPLIAECLIESPHNIVPLVQIGDYYDFLGIPIDEKDLITDTNLLGPAKILSISPRPLYFEKTGELTAIRLDATVFPNNQPLKKFIKHYEKVKKQNHIHLGSEMRLYEEIPPQSDSWCWFPKGANLRQTLVQLWQKTMQGNGFKSLVTPSFIHTDREPYFICEGKDYTWNSNRLKAHAEIYQIERKNGQQFPFRYAEQIENFNPLSSSELHGLLQTRVTLKDQWSIFCLPGQLIEELISSLQFIDRVVKILGFEYHWILIASRPGQTRNVRSKSGESYLEDALKQAKFSYTENFRSLRHGPRIEMRLYDGYGRSWVGPEITLVSYEGKQPSWLLANSGEGGREVAVISGSLFGSLERVIALLIEKYAGVLPLWLTPEQVRILPVRAGNDAFALTVQTQLQKAGFRAEVDAREETLGARVHAAEIERVPHIAIIGNQEESKGAITVRSYSRTQMQRAMSLEQLISQIQRDCDLCFHNLEEKESPTGTQRGEKEQVES